MAVLGLWRPEFNARGYFHAAQRSWVPKRMNTQLRHRFCPYRRAVAAALNVEQQI